MTAPGTGRSILVSLGSNIEPEKNLVRAVELLADEVNLVGCSRVFATKPVADTEMAVFLNAAVEIESERSPGDLKFGVLRAIEAELGRRRVADKNAPREIDMDISLYGDQVIENEPLGLVIPDPEISTRLHVARPLADLAPERCCPGSGQTLAEIARTLEQASTSGDVLPFHEADLLFRLSTRGIH